MRAGILAQELVSRGHEVHWWVSAFEHQRRIMQFGFDQEIQTPDGIHLHILKGCGYKRNISLRRYIDHKIIASKFRRASEHLPRPDVIVTATPCYHLAYEAVRYAKANGIPSIVDVEDLWPDIFIDHLPSHVLKHIGGKLLSRDYKKVEYMFKNADSIVAVSNTYLLWGLNKAHRERSRNEKVFLLGYKPLIEGMGGKKDTEPVSSWLKERSDQKLFTFIGSFGYSYELDLLVKAARIFHGKDRICFVLAGAGEQYDEIKRKTRSLDNVVVPGWIGRSEIEELLQTSHVGLLPYVEGAPQSIPNKPIEYLSSGLPIISSLGGEMAALVDTYRFGINYDPGNIDELCSSINLLADNSDLHREMSSNARRFFMEYGDSDKIYSEYSMHVEEMSRIGQTRSNALAGQGKMS